jgi:hypothetical protein
MLDGTLIILAGGLNPQIKRTNKGFDHRDKGLTSSEMRSLSLPLPPFLRLQIAPRSAYAPQYPSSICRSKAAKHLLIQAL